MAKATVDKTALRNVVTSASRRSLLRAMMGDGVATRWLSDALAEMAASLSEFLMDYHGHSGPILSPNHDLELLSRTNLKFPDGWLLRTGSVADFSLSTVAADTQQGTRALKFVAPDTIAVVLELPEFPIRDGRRWRFTVGYKATDTTVATAIQVKTELLDSAKAVLATITRINKQPPNTSYNEEVSDSIVSDANVRFIRPLLDIKTVVGATILIDRLTVEPLIYTPNAFVHTYFRVYMNGDSAQANNVLPIPFDAENFDSGNFDSAGGGTRAYTAPEDGYYRFVAQATVNAVAAGTRVELNFQKNSVDFGDRYEISVHNTFNHSLPGDTGLVRLNKGDVIRLRLFLVDAAWTLRGNSTGAETFFSGWKVADL